MAEERREPVADETLADQSVAVAVRAERRLGVGHVEDAETVEAEACVDRCERRLPGSSSGP